MKIRRFYSKSMRNALKQVTDEFGNDAAILSSQKTPSGVEVIAALDYDAELLPESIASLGKRKEELVETVNNQNKSHINQNPSISSIENRIIDKQESEQQLKKHNAAMTANSNLATSQQPQLTEFETPSLLQYNKSSDETFNNQPTEQLSSIASKNKTLPRFDPKASDSNLVEWSTDPGLIAMKEELALMRSMMKEQLDGIGWERLTERDPVTAMLNRRLSSLGISQSIIDQLIPRINSQLDPECCWQNLLALLAKSIPTDMTNIIAKGGILAFMGAAGSGKTTTIAKLAARYVIKHGQQSVALITTDNYRAAGRLQLQSFAKILNLPVAQVSSANSLDKLLDKFSEKKLILIDTPGMNRNDTDIADQLKCLKYTSGVSNINTVSGIRAKQIKKFLLLPATHQQSVLQQSLSLFKSYKPDGCIITKLDEATSLGEVLSLLIENKLPVAYTTDGQKVPENIRVARNHHLVSKAVWLTGKYKPENSTIVSSEKKIMKVAG